MVGAEVVDDLDDVSELYTEIKLDRVDAAASSEDSNNCCEASEFVLAAVRLAQ
jgi:hypothetical protein